MGVAERRERQVNQLELVSRWADDLAHEIKNPLHAMVINLELVKRRATGEDAGALIQRAEVVESELYRVHALVDSLLRLVRPWPDTTTADVDAVLEGLLPVFQARSRIRRVEYIHRPGGGIARVSPGVLAQVVLNLVDNALDALPEGGRLETRTGGDDGTVRIEVIDSGSGLPRELADRVREPGVSGRHDRSGLGLAVASRLVGEAGGTLSLEREGEAGTRAIVALPRSGSA